MRVPSAALALVVCVAAGCDSFSPSDALVDSADVRTDRSALAAPDGWSVVAAVSDGKAYRFPRDVPFSVTFAADGKISGRVSVNVFGANGYYVAAADGSFRADPGYQTLVGGSDRDNELSDVFLAELGEATRFEIVGAALQVRSADGDGVRLESNGFRALADD